MMDAEPHPLVEMRGIRKSFGSAEVLHGVDFDVRSGEVHVLAGENGAGKSTLVKILSGVFDDFTGEMIVGGVGRRFSHPGQAAKAGIATIHQELSLVPPMSVSDNLFLGREHRAFGGRVDFHRQEAEAVGILADAAVAASPRELVEDLPIAAQQGLEIARALARDASVVILDEPTSALGEGEAEALFRRIRELRDRGRGIVYITHRMEEIYRLADRITVLRDGLLAGTARAPDLSPRALVALMVGRELEEGAPADREPPTEVVLEVRNLRVAHPRIRSRSVVEGVGFTLRKGEVLGLAGLAGSGKSEVLHALFGALEGRASGTATLVGKPLPLKDPPGSFREGMVLLTNDRKALGLAPDMSVTHTVGLASLRRFSSRLGWVRRAEERSAVGRLTRAFRLRAHSLDAPVRILSGGNQQKAYLARCLLPSPRVLLLDEPTRGIDVGAKTDIYRLMEAWTREGIAILLTTSELEELITLSHRILVMHRGRLAAELPRGKASKDAILSAAMGHGSAPEEAE
jgi:ABC-type sugar transport system ATPase subunit